jgi:hypothetical protein
LTAKRVAGQVAAAVCGIVLLLSGGTSLHSQQTLRDLTGSVEDGHHEPLRGAVVYLENEKTHAVVTYITDRSGHFSFKRLHGDVDYDVWAIFRGQQSKSKTLSQFDTHTDPVITLVIKPEEH